VKADRLQQPRRGRLERQRDLGDEELAPHELVASLHLDQAGEAGASQERRA